MTDVTPSRTGISQRDMNYYEFLAEEQTKTKILASVSKFWETEIKDKWDVKDCKQCLFVCLYHFHEPGVFQTHSTFY